MGSLSVMCPNGSLKQFVLSRVKDRAFARGVVPDSKCLIMSALTLAAVAAAVVLAHSGEDGDARDEVPDASEACPRLRLDGADNATAARCGRFLLRDGEVHFRPNYRAETGAEGAAERAAQQRQRDQLVQLRDDMGRLTDAQSRTLAHLNQLLRRETRAAPAYIYASGRARAIGTRHATIA